jgi:tetratricopeptide (TPR) repeat protein
MHLDTIFTLLLIAALSFMTGCQTPTHAEARVQAEQRWSQVRGQVKLQLARQQFERGLFEDTVKTLKEATALDQTSPESFAMLAKANLELGKSTTAEQALDAAAKLGLASAELHYLHGVVLEQRNELAAALSEYEKARTLDPTKVTYLLVQVETLVALERPDEALALADANANQFDDDASVALLGARIAVLTGDAKGALERFRNPAIQNAGSRVATEELGSLLASQGHCPEAIRILQPLCELVDGPEISAGARRSLAECYLKGNEGQLAIHVLSGHAAANPADGASQLLLAKVALAGGEYMTALQAIELARRGKPVSSDFELLLAATHWKRGDLAGAESVLDGILNTNPADVDAWCLMGEVLYGLDRIEESRTAFERALDLDPECRWAADQLGGTDGQNLRLRSAEKKIPKKS